VRRGERGAPILPSAAAARQGSYPIIDRHAAIQVKSDSKIKPALTKRRDGLGSRPIEFTRLGSHDSLIASKISVYELPLERFN
jgi:hypothetical protein